MSNISYTEFKNQQEPFDWNKFLAIPVGDYTYDEVRAAETFAMSWVTCACGVQCSILPRNADGSPEDLLLRTWGLVFMEHIEKMKWAIWGNMNRKALENQIEAKKVLEKIEIHSTMLVNRLFPEPSPKPNPNQ